MSDMSENKGVIYIVRNELFPEFIKIGSTQDLEKRIKELSGTNIPVAYECLFAGEVKNYKDIEKNIHILLDSERIKGKEFFKYENDSSLLKIVDGIKNLMKHNVGFRDITQKVEDVSFTNSTAEQKKYLKNEQQKSRRENFNFTMVGIENGTELISAVDDNFKCKVVNNKKVSFEGEEQTLSEAALKVLHRKGHNWKAAQGSNWWHYQGETLSVIRERLETKVGATPFMSNTVKQKKHFKNEQQKSKRESFNFPMVGIENGTELVSAVDDNFKCKVVGNKKVSFEGEEQTLSEAALKVLNRKGHNWKAARGSDWWKYQEETLTERRMRLEKEGLIK